MTKKHAKSSDAAGAETPLGPAIAAAAEVVRRDGAIARTALARLGIPKKRVDEALEALARDGLEVTAKSVRVPLREQVLCLLADGAVLGVKAAAAGISGATKPEITKAVAALVDAGDARLVLRTKELALVGARTDVVADPELQAVERALDSLLKATKLARKKRASLLRADVEQAMSRFVTARQSEADANGAVTQAAARAPAAAASIPSAPPRKPATAPETSAAPAGDAATGAAGSPASAPSTGEIARLVERHRDASGLTFVPTLVRALGGEDAREAVHAELLRGARSGTLELRPESGLGRLSSEDLALCIPGPQGSRLSWVRRVEP